MILSRVFRPLQPVIELALRLDTVLSPALWLMNWQAWLSGSTHVAARLAAFGTRPTREQLDRGARLPTKNSPAVQARGTLAMLRWSITDELPRIDVPALVFAGGRDLITQDHAGETIAADLPQARLVRVDDAGHMGPVERAAVYNEQLADFADFGRLLRSRPAAASRRSFLSPDADLAPAARTDEPWDRDRPGLRPNPSLRPI